MRQLLGPKKVAALAQSTGLPLEKVMVRGGTDHRRDLCLTDGRIFYLDRNGEIEDSGMNWKQPTEARQS